MSNPFDMLLPGPPAKVDTYRWGTVTGLAPLRIQLDGDAAPVGSTPATLATVTVGDRVWVQLHGLQLIVIGRKF